MLWCLLSLTIGATQALCLEVGRECSPSAAVPAGPCHEQAPDSGMNPVCGSCIDVFVPEDSSARCNRPDRNLHAFAALYAVASPNEVLSAMADAIVANAESPIGKSSLHPFIRITVLRI